jgi:hypothetical protein
MIKRNLQTVAAVAAMSVFSEGQLRWWIFMAASNGLDAASAVVRIGRRVYIDIDRFNDWIEQQNASHPSPGSPQRTVHSRTP